MIAFVIRHWPCFGVLVFGVCLWLLCLGLLRRSDGFHRLLWWWCGYWLLLAGLAWNFALCLNWYVTPVVRRWIPGFGGKPPAQENAKRRPENAADNGTPVGRASGCDLPVSKTPLPLMFSEQPVSAAGRVGALPRRKLFVVHPAHFVSVECFKVTLIPVA